MDNVLADIDIADPTANIDSDEEMADLAPRAVQKQEKQTKEKKEKRKEKGESKEGKGVGGEKKMKRKHGEDTGDWVGRREEKVKR